MFNSTAYRESVRQRRNAASEIGFWGGVALTIMTGGDVLRFAQGRSCHEAVLLRGALR